MTETSCEKCSESSIWLLLVISLWFCEGAASLRLQTPTREALVIVATNPMYNTLLTFKHFLPYSDLTKTIKEVTLILIHWPWHVRSSVSSLWPFWQLHSKEPTVFRQKWSQPPLFSWHSSMSEREKKLEWKTKKWSANEKVALNPNLFNMTAVMFKSSPVS